MLTTDRVAGGALVLLALVVFWESRRLPLGSLRNPGPAYMPVALAAVLLCFGALLVVLAGKAPKLSTVSWTERSGGNGSGSPSCARSPPVGWTPGGSAWTTARPTNPVAPVTKTRRMD